MNNDVFGYSKSNLIALLSSKQIWRFAISGVGVTAFHVVIAIILISGFGLLSTVANAIAFVLATIVSYTVNTLWSFSSNPDRRNMLRFLIVALIGCFLTVAVSAAAQSLGLHYLYGIGLITLIVPPTTFLLHRYWTYR